MSEPFAVTGDFQHITIFWKEKALRFASLLMYFQFMQYIFDNKKPRDRHRLKVGRGFLRGLHKNIGLKVGTCKQIFQISFAEQFRMNDSTPIVNTAPETTMQSCLLITPGTWRYLRAFILRFSALK
jgi:hypothetical protein